MKTTGRKTVKAENVSAPKTAKVIATPAAHAVKAPPTHEEIARRSYELYLERGAVDGFALDDWMRAEAELKA